MTDLQEAATKFLMGEINFLEFSESLVNDHQEFGLSFCTYSLRALKEKNVDEFVFVLSLAARVIEENRLHKQTQDTTFRSGER